MTEGRVGPHVTARYNSPMSKIKRKPGWRQAAAEHQAWLDRVSTMRLSDRPLRAVTKVIDPVVRGPVIAAERLQKGLSLASFGGAGTKPVVRPHVQYAHQPELLARELAARQVRHNAAPAYNKGGAVYVTEEELTRQLVGSRRR